MFKYFLEVRNKLVLTIVTFFSTILICYWYKDVLLFLVTQMHLNDKNLYFIFTDVTEIFYIYFTISFFVSTQITFWYLLYYIFSFLSTAFYGREFIFVNFLFKSGTLFWILSISLSSYILIPFGWNFFLSFQCQDNFYFEARASEYLSFYFNTYLICFMYGQLLTIFFLFLHNLKKNNVYIKKYRKLYYYAFLILSTLITPPDVISQIVSVLLILVIYEIVLFFLIIKFWNT